jgi:hypothetical protein
MTRNNHSEFLKKLADLCNEYNAGFTYTKEDDGIHILVDNEEVFVGFIDADASLTIRKAIS